jgi:8-oxo-dGTP pyrophosphatase MutT (NUDIX family)
MSEDNELVHCAGLMFLTDNGNTLLLKYASNGLWSFPGGHIKDGETAEEAVARECVEEIGFLPEGERRLWTRRITSDNNQIIDYKTYIQRISSEFDPHLSNEHTDFAWVHVSKVLPHNSLEPENGREIVR